MKKLLFNPKNNKGIIIVNCQENQIFFEKLSLSWVLVISNI